ncbi:MAG: HAD-IA family hydrolase [Spirochaetes bacterium]|nr:HAD-IA family hydrolase [Spirochaetota bacterium]
MNIKGILFDFDLTLADSSLAIINCINFALLEMNYNIPDDYSIKRTIGMKLEDTFIALTGKDKKDEILKFKKLFIAEADRIMSDLTFLFDDVYKTIKSLKNKNLKLGIISTKFRYRIENILQKVKLCDHFDIIIGGEDIANHKPHPEGLLKALKFLALSPEDVYYIGDSLTDQLTAEKAKVKFIATLTGCTKKEEFDKYFVYKFINNLEELENLI